MNQRKKVGIATIGQSPRVDVVPEIEVQAGVPADFLECGILDGLAQPEIEDLAPEKGDYMLVTRLRDGSQVTLARRKIIDKMQECIDFLARQGAEIIIVLCVGEWPKFRSSTLVVTPSQPFCGFALGLLNKGDKLGLIVPAVEQIDDFKGKWSKEGVDIIGAAAAPYGPTARAEVTEAAGIIKEGNVDLIVMDCPGYTDEVREIVRQVTGKPVLSVRSAIAAMIRQLLG
jgi:protein AroM